MAQKVLSISQISAYIQSIMDEDALLAGVAVRGEISNYKLYPSGHHYFTLKDDGAALKCVMFRGNTRNLKFRPDNGMQVIAMGKISVYPRDGVYQLYCTAMAMDGVGDLYAAFEQLKKKLAAQGLFDPAHKKKLPAYPGVIGIVTSAAGAALHDMLRIINVRYPLVKVRLFPVRVQGAEAPSEIAAAIMYADKHKLADVLIVGRGGGSIEDLWAFNDEQVAKAIYRCAIPIISAVGHEPDITISDYVADVRAATPSNAAELVVPDRDSLLQQLDGYQASMASALQRQLTAARRHLQVLSESSALKNPQNYIKQQAEAVSHLKTRLVAAQERTLFGNRQRFLTQTAKLDAMSPLKVLLRGYAIASHDDGTLVSSVSQTTTGEHLRVRVSDGIICTTVTTTKEDRPNESEKSNL